MPPNWGAPYPMRWPDDLDGWPHAALSRRIDGPVHRWHVQDTAPKDAPDKSPAILLLHGAGGSTHSWRGIFESLGQSHRVITLDLPGHGFTQSGSRSRSGLAPMATDIAALAADQGWPLHMVVGHSAGGAIALQMALNGTAPRVTTFNAALNSFEGVAGFLFPVLAKILATTPFAPAFFARTASAPAQVRNLLNSTGSKLDDDGIALYRRLIADPDHIAGTLRMMAQWDLKPLRAALPTIQTPVHMITGARDKTVSPRSSIDAALQIPNAQHLSLENLGHLAHEEDTPRAVEQIQRGAAR